MAVRFTYHGSPFAQQIMNQGFRPGGLISIAPGQVFSSPNAAFASSYGSPVRMVTPTSALSIPSANLNMKTIGSEVIQSPKAATKGMNLASKVGTTYTGPTAQRLMSGATVAGLGAPPSSSLAMRAVGGPFGLAALAGQGIGMGVDAIARATNTPEEYEAMKEAARAQGGFGYFDDVDISQDAVSPVGTNEPMDIEDFLGTSTPQNLGFIEAAPEVKEAIYQDRIMNPNLPGFAVQPSRFQSFKNQISGLKDFLPFGPKSLTGMAARGIGSMLSDIAPRTYGYSQRTYDAMTPSQQEFVDDLYETGGLLEGYNKISAFGRGPLGTLSNRLGTIQNTLAKQKVKSKALQQREQQISNAINEAINRGERQALSDRRRSVDYGVTGGPTRTDIDVADGGAESGGRGKIVCTMMNERYGFGSFRNKIWMKFHESYGPEYQKGYHAIFLPLVKIAKGEGKINTAVRKVL